MSDPNPRHVRLTFVGNDIDPSDITRLLGASPTKAARMGEPLEFIEGRPPAQKGMWELRRAISGDPADLATEINALFADLTPDIKVWDEVVRKYGGGLTYSMAVSRLMDGIALPTDVIKSIADRGLSFGAAIHRAE